MYHAFNFVMHQDEYVYDDKYVFLSNEGCRLRKHDENLDYHPLGYYEESTVELPNLQGAAIRELTGVHLETTIPDGSALSFRASRDNGVTWEWYNGVAWAVAGVGDWSTQAQIDAGTATFVTRQFKLKIKLTPTSDGKRTPLILRVYVMFEAIWNFFEDLKRSLKHYIDNDAVSALTWSEVIGSSVSSITLETNWAVLGVDSVYDLTNDPGRLVNLYSSLTPGPPPVVNLTGAVPSGVEVEVWFQGKCQVFLAADEDLQISEVPAIVVIIPRAREDRYSSKNLWDYEPLASKGVYRRRDRRTPVASTVLIYGLGATEMDTQAIVSALAELFEPELSFLSAAVGEDFFCLTYEPLIDNDIVRSGLHAKAVQVTVVGNVELRAYVDLKPASAVGLQVAGALAVGDQEGDKSNPFCAILTPEEGDI